MGTPLRLMAVLAHPDDESLGCGGTLARYADEGVETYVLTATRGQAGRHGLGEHPGREAVGEKREGELRAAADVLGVRGVDVLDYEDGELDRADPVRVMTDVVGHLRLVRPQVVLTFAHDGAYGHPDHIAVSQATSAAVVAAADPGFGHGVAHRVSKLYQMAWSRAQWEGYQTAFKTLTSRVDGVVRRVTPWPDWSLTTEIDATRWWRTVWRAVQCHESQMGVYEALGGLTEAQHEALWGNQTFYRAMSLVNGGRRTESDLFEGIR